MSNFGFDPLRRGYVSAAAGNLPGFRVRPVDVVPNGVPGRLGGSLPRHPRPGLLRTAPRPRQKPARLCAM